MTDVRLLFVTAPSDEVAERVARTLVEERLAACVNLLPGVRSIYRWKGTVEEGPEVLMILKTDTRRVEVLTERVRALHPYEEPELLVVDVTGGSSSYLDWVLEETRAPERA